jgi:hypothetical protein
MGFRKILTKDKKEYGQMPDPKQLFYFEIGKEYDGVKMPLTFEYGF